MYSLDHARLSILVNGQSCTFHLKGLPSFDEHHGVRIWVEQEDALSGFRWKIFLESEHVVTMESLNMYLKTDYTQVKNIFCNGFQSWSESKLYKKNEKISGIKAIVKPIMEPFGDYSYYQYSGEKGVLHSWGYTFSKLPAKKVWFAGSLDEQHAFTNFIHQTADNSLQIDRDVKGWEVSGNVVLADIFFTEHSERGALQHFFLLKQFPEVKSKPAIGWTSWYYHYTGITEDIILKNLNAFKDQKLPIDIFQIDDGYQQAVGDWLQVNKKFSNGMAAIASAIKSAGYKPGIWLAPLAAEKKSDIFRKHPDWLMKNAKGKPYRIGFNPLWSGSFYALDIYHPEVREYVKKVFSTVIQEWGFELLKLDFLYGACLVARNGRSRAGVMHDAMQLLREAAGDKEILGCGIPMGTAPGFADYCRIGADVHLSWDFGLLKWSGNRERVSTILALQNTINRRHLNQHAFINDPDVFILRKKKQHLNQQEQYTLLLVNQLFGDLLFTSDDINEYDAATMKMYTSIFPLLDKKDITVDYSDDFYRVHFGIGERRFLALINLSDEEKLYKLPPGIFFDPLQQEVMSSEQTILLNKHQSMLLHMAGAGLYAVLGSKGHFFAGAEVKKVALSGDNIQVQLIAGLQTDPEIFLKIPDDVSVTYINHQPAKTVRKKGFNIVHAIIPRHESSIDHS
jgi:alpha-galactosidase